MRRVRVASCILLHALLATACGGSDSTASSVAPPGEPEGGVPPAAGDAGPRFSVLPAELTVPVGRSQIFVAPDSTGVTWSVLEGDAGGSVDANGRYTAPKKAGTYHLVASTGSASGEATVTVADYTLSILAGAKGGSGNLDGTGSDSRFRQPSAITNDGAGTLYVGDTYNAVIRKVVVATGVVTTLAGTGAYGYVDAVGTAASFGGIGSLAIDKVNGVLYVSDRSNNAVRSVDLKTGAVSTLAGGNAKGATVDGVGKAAQFSGPAGVAYVDGVVYVTDSTSHILRRIDVATRQVTTVAGKVNDAGSTNGTGTDAQFFAPSGITVVDATLLYIADIVNNRVRRVDIGGGGTTYT